MSPHDESNEVPAAAPPHEAGDASLPAISEPTDESLLGGALHRSLVEGAPPGPEEHTVLSSLSVLSAGVMGVGILLVVLGGVTLAAGMWGVGYASTLGMLTIGLGQPLAVTGFLGVVVLQGISALDDWRQGRDGS